MVHLRSRGCAGVNSSPLHDHVGRSTYTVGVEGIDECRGFLDRTTSTRNEGLDGSD